MQTPQCTILKAVDWNFRASATTYQTIEKRLTAIQEPEQLEALFSGVMRSKEIDEFLGLLPKNNNEE